MRILILKTKLMKFKVFILLTFSFMAIFAQSKQESNCPPEFPYGKLKIELFLTVHDSKFTQKSGTSNEKISQVESVSDSKECKALRTFIEEHNTYREFNRKITDEETIYFYKTSNSFYVFWNYKPEFFRPRMGSTKPFVVVNKDLTESWLFNL